MIEGSTYLDKQDCILIIRGQYIFGQAGLYINN